MRRSAINIPKACLERGEAVGVPSLGQTRDIYILKESDCLYEIATTQSFAVLEFERYGGNGVGANGGGVRCGNLNGYQIKGIGTNCLVGESDDYSHSNGIYSLEEGLLEYVNSTIYKKILPVGVVNSFELIILGKSGISSAPSAPRDYRVVLVREICTRPAHFLPATGYKIPTKLRNRIRSDIFRVRAANRELFNSFDSQSELVKEVGFFLNNCANQFAFCKIFRIAHGTMSPSNISFDGRWLDLSSSTFVDRCENYQAGFKSTPFQSEIIYPALIIDEFFNSYSKFNKTEFNIKPLVDYYRNQCSEYFSYHTLTLLGLPAQKVYDFIIKDDLLYLSRNLIEIIDESPSLTRIKPSNQECWDKVGDNIYNWFAGKSQKTVQSEKMSNLFFTIMTTSIKEVIRSSESPFKAGTRELYIFSALRGFRQQYYRPIFFAGRLKSHIANYIESTEEINIKEFISDVESAAGWIFSDNDVFDRVIYKGNNTTVRLSECGMTFEVITGNTIECYNTSEAMIKTLRMNSHLFCINGFYCVDVIEKITVRTLEVANSDRVKCIEK